MVTGIWYGLPGDLETDSDLSMAAGTLWPQDNGFQDSEELGRVKRSRAYNWLKNDTRPVFTEVPHFFLNKNTLNMCRPLVNFQISDNVNFDHFTTVLKWRAYLRRFSLYSPRGATLIIYFKPFAEGR